MSVSGFLEEVYPEVVWLSMMGWTWHREDAVQDMGIAGLSPEQVLELVG